MLSKRSAFKRETRLSNAVMNANDHQNIKSL